MKLSSLSSPILVAALLLAPALHAAEAKAVMPSGDAKKLAARYALTKTRIETLLGPRQHPVPLPATPLPNPFYKPDASLAGVPQPEKVETPVPDAPDLTDADALAKYASTLRIGGYLTLGGAPHVAVNSVICKVGDVITAGTKDHPLFLRIESITPQEFVLKLNEATFTVQIKK
jgi:hypothetical protein